MAPLGQGVAAYDALKGTAHRLNHTGGEVLGACNGATDDSVVVELWRSRDGVDVSTAQSALAAAVDEFERLGLVGRADPWEPMARLSGACSTGRSGVFVGRAHLALDRTVHFRGTDRGLVECIDEFLISGRREPDKTQGETVWADVERRDDGQIEVEFGERFLFPTLNSCLLQVTTVVNRLAGGPGPLVTLHAGGVRSPRGEIVVVAAESGGGKSTMIGALVQAGWDYLGDENIGVGPGVMASGYPKRIGLDDTGRAVLGLESSDWIDTPVGEVRPDVVSLGGEVGPIDRVILVNYVPGAQAHLEPLEGIEALRGVLVNTLTLGADGDRGLATLCELAETVPVGRLTHGDAHAAAQMVSSL